jgi:putative transposase
MNLISFSHSYGQCAYHIILVPYKRRKIFNVPGLKDRIEKIFHLISDRYKLTFHALKVNPDHVHIFTSLPLDMSLSKLFQILKGLSSYLFFKDRPKMRQFYGKLWSKGKFFRSVGSVTDEAVKYYIENQ